jgi:hypothetical protein
MIESIFSVVTMIVTFIFGKLAKRFNWLESDYIPLQNLLIGMLAGILVYLTDITDNLAMSIVLCIMSAFGAGGIYDFIKMKSGGE